MWQSFEMIIGEQLIGYYELYSTARAAEKTHQHTNSSKNCTKKWQQERQNYDLSGSALPDD